MAAKEDGENASQEVDQRIVDLALQAVWVRAGTKKVCKGGKDGGKNPWQKGQWQERKQRAREKVARETAGSMLDVWQDRTHCSMVQERRQQKCVRHR